MQVSNFTRAASILLLSVCSIDSLLGGTTDSGMLCKDIETLKQLVGSLEAADQRNSDRLRRAEQELVSAEESYRRQLGQVDHRLTRATEIRELLVSSTTSCTKFTLGCHEVSASQLKDVLDQQLVRLQDEKQTLLGNHGLQEERHALSCLQQNSLANARRLRRLRAVIQILESQLVIHELNIGAAAEITKSEAALNEASQIVDGVQAKLADFSALDGLAPTTGKVPQERVDGEQMSASLPTDEAIIAEVDKLLAKDTNAK